MKTKKLDKRVGIPSIQRVLHYFINKKNVEPEWVRIQDVTIGINSNAVTVSVACAELVNEKILVKKQTGANRFVYKLNPIYDESDVVELTMKLVNVEA